ncbi:hypothetical protein [Amycolatopsis sp. CA-128772]|uniref:hypothetical protein n=1 Tax=Amycolatopsis sp. CA-128772 TaxID=2073159 RepID=UPI0018EE1CEB|nr:hypothetical protein [Amycolatopsis sp. CA-128772]
MSDVIRRDLTAPAPGLRLAGDITCLPTFEGWLYLAIVIFTWLRYYNHRRLRSTVGQHTPAEARTAYYAQAHAA